MVPLHAQTVSGTVTGTITDPSGAIVKGVSVKVKNADTGEIRFGTTNNAGFFSIPALPPGPYMVDAQVTGFEEVTSTVTVSVGQTLNINFHLQVGSASEKVDVFSGGSLGLQTESHELSDVMNAETLEDSPANAGYRGDTFYAQTTEVGVQAGSALGDSNIGSNVSQYNAQSNTLLVGGAGFWSASYLEDGVVDMSYFDQQATVQPPPEAVQETEVIRNSANARYLSLIHISHDHEGRAELITILQELIAGLALYQDRPTGLWYQIVDQPELEGNWTETSSSSMFTYIIDVAIKRGYVARSYRAAAQHGYKGVMSRLSVGEDGLTNLTEICTGTNVGDLAWYLARPRMANDLHGLGAFLLMNEEWNTSVSSMKFHA